MKRSTGSNNRFMLIEARSDPRGWPPSGKDLKSSEAKGANPLVAAPTPQWRAQRSRMKTTRKIPMSGQKQALGIMMPRRELRDAMT